MLSSVLQLCCILDSFLLRLDHTQHLRMTNDHSASWLRIWRIHIRPVPHLIMKVIARETMHQIETVAADLHLQVGRSLMQVRQYL